MNSNWLLFFAWVVQSLGLLLFTYVIQAPGAQFFQAFFCGVLMGVSGLLFWLAGYKEK